MTVASSILLIDSDESDRALAMLLLQREMPEASVAAPTDAAALAGALATQTPDVAIVAAGLTWRGVEALVSAIKGASPTAAVVLFGHESDILARGLNPGLACDGIVRKSSAGFLGLPAIVAEILERARRAAAAATTRQPDRAASRGYAVSFRPLIPAPSGVGLRRDEYNVT